MSETISWPLIQPVVNPDVYVSGDVTIHPRAAIASGVILQAAPGTRIIVHEGACIGMGTILNAYQGSIEIETGAVLGAGVLILGKAIVGANACVGAATTIINTDIASKTIVSAGSLLGDRSREVDLSVEQAVPQEQELEPEIAEILDGEMDVSPWELDSEEVQEVQEVQEEPVKAKADETPAKTPAAEEKGSIVGKMYVNNLLVTLFPHGQSLNRNQKNDNNV